MDKNSIIEYIERWSAMYSPFAPLEQHDIQKEMESLAQAIPIEDFDELLSLMKDKNDDDDFVQQKLFMGYYIKHNQQKVTPILLGKLKSYGPWQIIKLIGYTGDSNVCSELIKNIDYSELDSDGKFALIDSFDLLKNISALEYLENLKHIEADKEILDEIDGVIYNLSRIR